MDRQRQQDANLLDEPPFAFSFSNYMLILETKDAAHNEKKYLYCPKLWNDELRVKASLLKVGKRSFCWHGTSFPSLCCCVLNMTSPHCHQVLSSFRSFGKRVFKTLSFGSGKISMTTFSLLPPGHQKTGAWSFHSSQRQGKSFIS